MISTPQILTSIPVIIFILLLILSLNEIIEKERNFYQIYHSPHILDKFIHSPTQELFSPLTTLK